MIKVSVIVPVYNMEKYLKKCLNSLINQTLQEIEVIVVDDGSTDNSIKIIEEFQEKHPDLIKKLLKENGGVGSTRNYGLKHARGKYVMFVDSDDYLEHTMIEELYNIIEKRKLDLVACDYYYEINNERTITTTNIKEGMINQKEYLTLAVAPWNKIYNKEFLKNTKYFYPEGLWYEDLATNPQLCLFTNKIYYLKKPLYNYFQRQESAMNKKKYNPKMLDIIKSLELMETCFIDNGTLEEYKEEVEFLFIEHLLHDASLRFLKFDNRFENIEKVNKIIKQKYPNWRRNKYYKLKNIKYKIVCNLIYSKRLNLLKLLLKKI